jgi:hypothetical protein
MDDDPRARFALQIFCTNLAMHGPTLTPLFNAAFASEANRNKLYDEEIAKAEHDAAAGQEDKEWMRMVGEAMLNDDVVRKVYSGTVVTAHNAMLQRFSGGLQMPNGRGLRVGALIRGVPVSHVLWAGRNMVQHHDDWEKNGGEAFVAKNYCSEYEVLSRISRGGGVMAVNALDVLIRLTEPERTYEKLERVVYECAIDIIRQKWPE